MAWGDGSEQNHSIYIAIPFCQVRCAYCDFNTYAGLNDSIPAYARALAKEIRLVGQAGLHPHAHTIFFGGGTPSLLPLLELRLIFDALRGAFDMTPDCEITLEANPGTVDAAYLEGLRDLGVNRLSLGVQSAHESELKLLDRLHTFAEAAQAVRLARAAGFENLNLDLIFGIPHQTLALWQETLARTLELESDHLSCYALSLEHGTPLRTWVYRGLLPLPDPDLAAEMYEWASEALETNGFAQYEISNWAKDEGGRMNDESLLHRSSFILHTFQCRHNLQYWRNLPYLGFGAGAHGSVNGWRYSNVLAPAAYIERLEKGAPAEFPFSPATVETIRVTPEDAINETMMLGFRLTREGVRDSDFRERFGSSLAEKYPQELKELRERGLIEWDAEGARLTKQGRLLGNIVFREFV